MSYLRLKRDKLWACCLLSCLMAFALTAIADSTALDDDQRFTRLSAPMEDEGEPPVDFKERARMKLDRFGELWSDVEFGEELHTVSDEVLSLRLRAAQRTAFTAPEPWVLERFRAVIEVAIEREIAGPANLRSLFEAYQVAWEFDAARSLRERHPDAELPEVPELVLPEEVDSQQDRIVWHVHTDPPRLKGEVVELTGPQLLVVSSPGCGFTRQAAQALTDDEILGPLMDSNTRWIAGPLSGNTFHHLAQWNRAFPRVPTVLVNNPDQWPVSGFDRFPSFYFVSGADVVKGFFGWSGGPQVLQAVADGFIELGLLDPEKVAIDAFSYAVDEPTFAVCAEHGPALQESVERARITTRDELDAYLAEMDAGTESPLGELSGESRSRLVSSIHFGSRGVSGFRHDDLEAHPEPDVFYQVVSLFGMQYFYAGHFFPKELLTAEELDLRDRINCAGEYMVE